MSRNGVHPILIASAAFLAVLTYAVLAWDRTYHSMVTTPQATDVRLALVLWSSTLMTYLVVVPFILASVRRALASISWPYLEAASLGVGTLIVALFVTVL